MADQAARKHRLSSSTVPRTALARQLATVLVVLSVATAPLTGVAGASATTADAAQSKVDIVFVFDSSASTNEDRYHLAQEVDSLATQLEDAGIDARYGLITYNGSNRVEQPLTSDFDSFEAAMHFSEGGSKEKASDAILTATSMDFRDDAKTVVVVVTDEDDDSSNATRSDAVSSLSASHFVAVSPSSVSESSCAVHSPPCDSRSDNELRTIADRVGGDWIDQGQSADVIVDEIADVVVDVAHSDQTDTQQSTSTSQAQYRTTNTSTNATTVEVGDVVRLSKTVQNYGDADGTYEAYLSHDGSIVAKRTVSIPAGESRTVTFAHQFDDAGEYKMLITHEVVATVNVTEPKEVSVDVAAPANGSRMNATVTDAWTNDTVSIPTNGTDLVADAVASIESLVVSTGAQNVTTAHDVGFDVELTTSETAPSGTAPLPADVAQARYVTLDSSLDNASVQFEFVPSADATTVYRYDAANATWVALETTAVNGTDGLLRTEKTSASLFAVAVRQPSISLVDVWPQDTTIDVGDSTRVWVRLSNDGAAAGTTNLTLRMDGTAVATRAVTIPAGETRLVAFTVAPDEAGTYTLDVSGGPPMKLQVESPTTTTTPSPTTTESQTTQTTTQDSSPGSAPGFGLVVALLALVGAALLAHRRT